MDGFKNPLNKSIQHKLSFYLSLIIFFMALMAGIFSFVSALHEAHELQDDMLRQVAALFDKQHLPLAHLDDTGRSKGSNEESRVIVQYLANESAATSTTSIPKKLDLSNEDSLLLPSKLSDGLHTLGAENDQFRVMVKTISDSERIAVAQEIGIRNEIARASALRTLLPFLILIPILVLIMANIIRKIFRPIVMVSDEIDQRSEQALHPVETCQLPIEVRPFVVAINRLLARVKQSMEVQRHFIADAAHELRSPLTALSLQAEHLDQTDMPESAQQRLTLLRLGIERSRILLDQLLSLATAQAIPTQPQSWVSIQDIYRRVLETMMPLAEEKGIDIGIKTKGAGAESDTKIWIDELDIMVLVKNLIDNAIRYTPLGGKVDLSVIKQRAWTILQIQDTGPGIPVAERARVFDRFYRILGSDEVGSGLGLSIVKTVADRMGARIELNFTDKTEKSGLDVCICIPTEGAVKE